MTKSADHQPIETARLLLACLRPSALLALAKDDLDRASEILGATCRDSWADKADAVAFRLADLAKDPDFLPWSMRAIVRKQDRLVVGSIGCHARPGTEASDHLRPAGVEFGYTVFAPYRRQGIAREAIAALMAWTLSHGASHFVLSIAPDNLASQNLAKSFGFRKVGTQIDDIDGPEDVLELRPAAPSR
jgi:RimJ/RimL family protein N-acetyltransferase